MSKKQTAIVVVSKDWMNSGVHHLVNNSRKSGSSGESHLLIAPLEDASDPRGLWLRDVEAKHLTTDGSVVKMRILVPWSFVLSVGLVEEDDQGAKLPPGFLAVTTKAA